MKPNRIFFITPDMPQPSGGISMIYDHAINLRKLGFETFVTHFSQNFKKISWRKFGSDITHLKCHYLDKMFELNHNDQGQPQLGDLKFTFTENDLIVIPEGFPHLAAELKMKYQVPAKIAMFAQGWLYIVPALQQVFKGQIPNLKQIGIEKVISVSGPVDQYIKDMFKYTEEETFKVSNFVDTNLFNLNIGEEEVEEVVETEDGELDIAVTKKPREKKNQIAFMPRKGMEKWYGIFFSLAQALGIVNGWEFVPIIGKSQEEVAEILKSSKIFVNFTEGEGFGLPALESILCGNLYIGNAGLGGEDFLDDDQVSGISFHNFITDNNNPYDWVKAISIAIRALDDEETKGKLEKASEYLADKYNHAKFLKELKKTYKEIMG